MKTLKFFKVIKFAIVIFCVSQFAVIQAADKNECQNTLGMKMIRIEAGAFEMGTVY